MQAYKTEYSTSDLRLVVVVDDYAIESMVLRLDMCISLYSTLEAAAEVRLSEQQTPRLPIIGSHSSIESCEVQLYPNTASEV